MGRDELQVTGGVGGVAAQLSDLRLHADRSDRCGDEVGRIAAELGHLALDGDLLASAVLSPPTAARAEAALVDVSARVTASALRLEASAQGLRTVANAWDALDRAAVIGQDVREVGTAGVLGLGGIGGTLLSAPFVYAHNVVEQAGAAVTEGWADGWGALWDGLAGAPSDAADDTADDLGRFWSETLLAMPPLTDAVVEGLGVGASLGASRPLAYEDTVVGLLGLAGLAGWFDDTAAVTVTRASLADVPIEDRADVVVPGGIGDLFRNQRTLMLPTVDDPGTSRLRIIDVGQPGQPAWVVQVPGTQEWGVTAGGDPSDLTSNLHLTGHEDAALLDAIQEAIAMTGVGGDDPVMVVGHSQGGIAAAAFAAQADDRGLNVTHVVTGGSPVAHLDVPDDVQVLSLEHTTDPVPRLDGDPNPDRPTWTTVTRDVGGPAEFDDPVAPHSSVLYADTGADVDTSTDPSVQAFLDGAAMFLSADETASITDLTLAREDP